MSHTKSVSRQLEPARAESLLVWAQKAAIFGSLATGVNTLASAFNTWTQGADRKGQFDS